MTEEVSKKLNGVIVLDMATPKNKKSTSWLEMRGRDAARKSTPKVNIFTGTHDRFLTDPVLVCSVSSRLLLFSLSVAEFFASMIDHTGGSSLCLVHSHRYRHVSCAR